jgi:peptidyl-prolyl cis-trans isomerase D
MAIIQQIQQKTGCLFLVILGSLLLFVISDLIKSDRGFFGDNSLSVGEIKGEKVSYEEFNARYNEMLNQVLESNPGINLDESMKSQYADQAWNSFLQDKIFADEYKKLGIQVSPDELADMTIGDHPDEQVVKAFQGQNGQFDKNRLIKFLQEDIEADEKTAARWLQFEEGLTQNTLGKKYAAVVRGSAYTTKLEAKQLWQNNNYAAAGSFVGIQYATIPDAEIKVTDEDLKKELNANKLKYKQDATRDIEFVSFSILPTSEDSAVTRNWAYDNVEKFRAYKYDSVFVNINGSEDPWDGTYKRIGSFDKSIENQLFALDSGGMIGPVYADGKYSIYKVSGTRRDSISVFKASHILVSLTTGTREDTINSQNRVNTILNDLKTGKVKFEDAAVPNADGSGGNQGDLGWVTPTSPGISKKFYTMASGAPEGQLFIVTDEFGIHIAKVTSPKFNKLIKVAVLSQTVSSGSNTIKTASQKANDFYAAARSNKDFGKAAEGLKLSKRVAYDIRESDITIPGITEPKQIVRWLYDEETKVGSVSEILSFQTNYVVAKCTKIKKEGTPEIEDIRPSLELAVRNKKKADRLEERFTKARAKSKTMAELAANVGSVEMLIPQQIFSNDNIPGVGYDLKVLGTLFGCGTNKFSPIIRGENAVYVVWVTNINKPQAPPTFDEFQKMSADQFKQGVDAGVMDALRKKAAIKDMRYKYF